MTTLFYGLSSNDEGVQKSSLKALKELFAAHAKHGVLKPQQVRFICCLCFNFEEKHKAMNGAVVTRLALAAFDLLLEKGTQSHVISSCALLLLALILSDRMAWNTAVSQLAQKATTQGKGALFEEK